MRLPDGKIADAQERTFPWAIAHVLIPGGVGIGQELAWLRKFDSGIAS
jgi:hypothetical protein